MRATEEGVHKVVITMLIGGGSILLFEKSTLNIYAILRLFTGGVFVFLGLTLLDEYVRKCKIEVLRRCRKNNDNIIKQQDANCVEAETEDKE